MTEPSPPAASKPWAIATIVTGAITAITAAVYVTMLTDAISTTWLAPRILQLGIYLLGFASVAFANRWTAEIVRAKGYAATRALIERRTRETRVHIDRRVAEAAQRMDARLARVVRGMENACVQLEENTGELRRIGGEYEMTGYSRGYADGRAGNRPHPDVPGDNVLAFEMGRRVERAVRDPE